MLFRILENCVKITSILHGSEGFANKLKQTTIGSGWFRRATQKRINGQEGERFRPYSRGDVVDEDRRSRRIFDVKNGKWTT